MKGTRYSETEVKSLIEDYTTYRAKKSTYGIGLVFMLRLVDIDRAVSLLTPHEYQAVLLHGMLGHTVRDAEELLGVSKSTLQRRYDSGIAWIARILNEGVVA